METMRDALDRFLDWRDCSLLFFDACRYDFFEEMYGEYIEGDLSKVVTQSKFTPDWFMNYWNGEYDIVLYDATSPWMVNEWDYDIRNHFTLVPPSEFEFEDESRLQPERINQTIFRDEEHHDSKKLIRYFQPHTPYLDSSLEEMTTGKRGKKTKFRKAIKSGEVTLEELRDAYEQNLRISFEAVGDLIDFLDEDLIITADHGEYLGERVNGKRRYFHGRYMPDHPVINHVPWFEVKK